MIFKDRREAVRLLSNKLMKYKNETGLLILALPRGGVPVAFEAAKALETGFDVFVVRKLGAPGQQELAIGAIAGNEEIVTNEGIIRELGISSEIIQKIADEEKVELKRRNQFYRKGKPELNVKSKTVILIDDGLATGASMKAAVLALRKMGAGRIIVAVPVAPGETCEAMKKIADEVICFLTPDNFSAVGEWFQDFTQTSDKEVLELL